MKVIMWSIASMAIVTVSNIPGIHGERSGIALGVVGLLVAIVAVAQWVVDFPKKKAP